jgi:[protein-PII] uridylyltransferase
MTAVETARSASAEDAVRGAFRQWLAGAGVALFAVGGFGRRELFPHSDIDLLIVPARDSAGPAVRDALSNFLRQLWDAGLRVSHAVHTPEECCELNERNVERAISLLDKRFLDGDAPLAARLEKNWQRFLQAEGPGLMRHLCRITRARHLRFQNTIYHLEPNVKDGPGGLRDIQVLGWLRQLRGAEPDASLERPREFLSGLRRRLHEQAGRDQNILSFDAQEAISNYPAELMRSYYRYARAVHQAVTLEIVSCEEKGSSLLEQFRDFRSRVSTSEFTVARGLVLLRSPAMLERDPLYLLRLFEFSARHGVRLAPDTLRRIAEASLPPLANALEWKHWESMLALPYAPAALRAMHESGVLGALLPEWRKMEALVIRDFHHRYTVDEHSLVAVEALSRIEDRRFSELVAETDGLEQLRFALLLHDTGKGVGNHIPESLRLARGALSRIAAPAPVASTVLFLIEHHLDLSQAMNSRDLSDPETGRWIAGRAGAVERLKLLTLFTWADISAVNPSAMSPWRAEQLWRAYLAGHEALTQELETNRIHAAQAQPERAAFLEGLPLRYLRTHSDEEIAAHQDMAARLSSETRALALDKVQGGWRLTLITRDRPMLFATVAGALSSFGMNIVKAEAYANAAGIVVDTFTFTDPLRTLELNPGEADRLIRTVGRVLDGRLNVEKLLKARPKPPLPGKRSAIPPRVSFRNDVSQTATLIEIVAQDRPALLYELASTISAAGCNIDVVLIDTEAHKALDVLYVSRNGSKLDPATESALRGQLLAICSP